MKLYTIRLKPGQEIRSSLMDFAKKNDLTAASIVTCVAGAGLVKLRMAGAQPDSQDIREYTGPYEVVSLVGTFSADDGHFHIALSDKDDRVIGGHLKSAIVHLTAEIVIINDENSRYVREPDEETGFTELTIKENDV